MILLEAFDLVGRNVDVPGIVSLQVKASDRAEGLPPLVANGKTVVQYGKIGAKSRQAQQASSPSRQPRILSDGETYSL